MFLQCVYCLFSVVPIFYSIVAVGILNEVNIIHVKLPEMFKYSPGIYAYCGCVINFIGHYMVLPGSGFLQFNVNFII